MLDRIIANAAVFLLVAVRTYAFLRTIPLFSMRNVPTAAKVALTAYVSYLLLPQINYNVYADFIGPDTAFSLYYFLVLAGEALIGVITGFYITIIFAAFSTAGQFFAFQMGFSASEVYDSVSQVENPLMGQYLNLIALLIFLQNGAFQNLFMNGLGASFKALSAYSLVTGYENLIMILIKGLTKLFADALIIALPLMGTLLLVAVSLGILTRAAPQMNLLSESFPLTILTAFFILTVSLPNICDFFSRAFYAGFTQLELLFASFGGNQI
ncbi:MAG: flagellar biosynthetic protein FliR [Treponema sp.]|nr:flagellar biosynthetic protein FliR [Treponema sp.]